MSKVIRYRLHVGLLLLLLFLALALSMTPQTVFPLDRRIMSFVTARRSAGLTGLAMAFNFTGSIYGIGIIWLALIIRLWRRDRDLAINLALSTFALATAVELLKMGIGRPRPPARMFAEQNFAFPSSHAAVGAYFFGWLTLVIGRQGSAVFRNVARAALPVLILLIGLSRIYVGAHWPSDVLAGYLLGAGMLLAVYGRLGKIR